MWLIGKKKKSKATQSPDAYKFVAELSRSLLHAKQTATIKEHNKIEEVLEEILDVFESKMLSEAKKGYNYIDITAIVFRLSPQQSKILVDMLDQRLDNRYGEGVFNVIHDGGTIFISLLKQ